MPQFQSTATVIGRSLITPPEAFDARGNLAPMSAQENVTVTFQCAQLKPTEFAIHFPVLGAEELKIGDTVLLTLSTTVGEAVQPPPPDSLVAGVDVAAGADTSVRTVVE